MEQKNIDDNDILEIRMSRRLFILYHSIYCSDNQCPLTNCSQIKEIIQHLKKCSKNKKCKFPYCTSSRKVLVHFKDCVDIHCNICRLTRNRIRDNADIKLHRNNDDDTTITEESNENTT